MFKKILVPLDGSRFSSQALRYAVDLAQRYGASVMLVEAVIPATPTAIPSAAEGAFSGVTAEMAIRAAQLEECSNTSKVGRYLRRKVREIEKLGVPCSMRIVRGSPARCIVATARRENADLVVMTTHGKGGLKRAIVGSVADEVVRESRTPVLLIR